MSRKLVVALCLINASLGFGLLWLIFFPARSSPRGSAFSPATEHVRELSRVDRWAAARAAGSAREAYYHLRGLEENASIFGEMADEVGALATDETAPAFGEWPFYEAVLTEYARRSPAPANLSLLGRIARDQAKPLPLREAAFRAAVEHAARLEAFEAAAALIEAVQDETDGLGGIALQAALYLDEKGVESPGLGQRAWDLLEDPQAVDSSRLAALSVVFALESTPLDPARLVALFNDSRTAALRGAVLRRMRALAMENGDARELLSRMKPWTSEEARLIHAPLEKSSGGPESPASSQVD